MTSNRLLMVAMLAVLSVVVSAGTADAQGQPKRSPTTIQNAVQAPKLIDLNSASRQELTTLPGIGEALSQKIIDSRPFARKDELVTKHIIPQATYDKIKAQVIATQKK